jgi:hypothetical protein
MSRTHPNLVGHWRFENNLLDTSGNGNDGTVGAGSAAYAAGKIGRAYNFGGANLVNMEPNKINAMVQGATGWTFAWWANLSSTPTTADVIQIHHNGGNILFRAGYHTSRRFRWSMATSDTEGTGSPSSEINLVPADAVGNWHHYAITLKFASTNGPVGYYVDGVLVSGQGRNFGGTSINTSAGTINDTIFDGVAGGLNGLYDDLQIWNRALQPHHIRAIYNGVEPAFLGDVV